jgi:hypothetical protein
VEHWLFRCRIRRDEGTMTFPILQTDRLILRQIVAADHTDMRHPVGHHPGRHRPGDRLMRVPELGQAHNRIEAGYELAREHWGRGIMSEALRAALGHAFDNWQCNRVQALVEPENHASIRLL